MVNNKKGRYECPCCGYFTLEGEAGKTFQICPVCYWEDDGIQFNDPTYEGGANSLSLNKAKENFQKFGVIEERFKAYVRPRFEEECINVPRLP